MTENKRFKDVEEKRDWGTIQYFTYNDEKITDDAIKHYIRVEEKIVNENEKLKKENEVLKEENKILKKTIKRE